MGINLNGLNSGMADTYSTLLGGMSWLDGIAIRSLRKLEKMQQKKRQKKLRTGGMRKEAKRKIGGKAC